MAPQRSQKKTIDLSLLRQRPPVEHLVDTGDVLGIFVEGVLGNAQTAPPVFVPNDQFADPSVGYPIRVDTDGTISLPLLRPLSVRGLTISQVRNLVRDAYTTGPNAMLQANRANIHVSLQKPRTVRVIVIREESGNEQGNRGAAAVVNFETEKRGTGRVVHLPAYRNDVLNALTATGGLPGLDAENVVYIAKQRRSRWRTQPERQMGSASGLPTQVAVPLPMRQAAVNHQSHGVIPASFQGPLKIPAPATPLIPGHASESGPAKTPEADLPPGIHFNTPMQASPWNSAHSYSGVPGDGSTCPSCAASESFDESNVIRIPLKLSSDELPSFRPEDVVLQDGDVVFVENRVTEFFYTAGLLGGGQLVLPRDYDLGIMDAIALAESENRRTLPTSAIGGTSVLNQDVSVGASRVVIQRKMPHGGFIPVEVNLYDVMKNPETQVMIRPEDRIILRYTRTEACLAFFERFFIDGLVNGASNAIIFRD